MRSQLDCIDSRRSGSMTRLSLFVVAALLLRCGPARAYIDTSMTLGKIIKDSQRIFVIDFEKMNSERKAILFKKVTDLKGKTSEVDFRFHLADAYAPGAPGDVLASAEPKARAVCFVTGRNTLLYLGNTWHLCHRDQDSEWWTVLSARPELSLAYIGSAHRLARHVGDILAGKDAIVTTIVHGATARGSMR